MNFFKSILSKLFSLAAARAAILYQQARRTWLALGERLAPHTLLMQEHAKRAWNYTNAQVTGGLLLGCFGVRLTKPAQPFIGDAIKQSTAHFVIFKS